MVERPLERKLSKITWFGDGYKLRTVHHFFGGHSTREQFFEIEKYGTAEKALEAATRAEKRFLKEK